jgi:hypothetical protein
VDRVPARFCLDCRLPAMQRSGKPLRCFEHDLPRILDMGGSAFSTRGRLARSRGYSLGRFVCQFLNRCRFQEDADN